MTDSEKIDIIVQKLISLESDISEVKSIVTKNYNLLEEFYVKQKEINTDMSDRLAVISGQLDMHNNQIARNTADIRRYK